MSDENTLDQITPIAEYYEPAAHTMDDVVAYVEAHPHERAQVLALERARGENARQPLIERLTDGSGT